MSQLPEVASQYPANAHFSIDFSGADPNGHPAVYFVKDEDAGSSKYRTHLFIRNESANTITLKPKEKSAESYHFQLRFRPGLVNGRMVRKMLPLFNELQNQLGPGWEWHDLRTRVHSDGVITVNLTYTGVTERPMKPASNGNGAREVDESNVKKTNEDFSWAPDATLNLQLRPVHDAPLSGGFFLKLELDYSPIFDDDRGIQHRLLNLAAIDLSGKTFFPLKADVIGSNTILNDGESPNQRTIHLWNTLAHSSVPIRSHGRDHESGTMITLAMRCHSRQDNNGMERHPTVMGTRGQVAATNLKVTPLEAQPVGKAAKPGPIWSLVTHEDVPGWVSWEINAPSTNSTYFINHDRPGQPDTAILESLEIELSNLISSAPDGISNIYIHFHHVPGYADHTIIVPLEKTPLVLRGQNVGVGVLPEDGQEGFLAVNGNVGIGLPKNADDTVSNPKIHLAIGDNDTGLKQQGDGELAIYTNNSERVRVNKNGRVGIGTTDPQVHLALGDTGNGLHRPETNKLAIHTKNAERVRIDDEGQVGIGIPNPNEQLHVNGNIKLEGRIQDKTGDLMPVGSIIAYGGSKAPKGWLSCDGSDLEDKPEYAELRGIIGKIWVPRKVDNKTEHKWIYAVPDLRSRFIIGAGQGMDLNERGLKSYEGEEEHTLTIEEMPRHKHTGKTNKAGAHSHSFGTRNDFDEDTTTDLDGADGSSDEDWSTNSAGEHEHTLTINYTGGNSKEETEPHNNLPPYYALTYIIKY